MVSRFQARAALYMAGLLELVETAIANSGDRLMQIAWADAQTFERGSPTVARVAAAINLKPAQIDELFAVASEITA